MQCRRSRTGPTRFGLSAFPLGFWGFHSPGHDLGGDGDDLLEVFLGEIVEGHEGLVGFVTQKSAEHVVDRWFAALCPCDVEVAERGVDFGVRVDLAPLLLARSEAR